MRISYLTTASITSSVWGNATRTLTALGNNFIDRASQGVLAASTSVDLRPSSGSFRWSFIVVPVQAGMTVGVYDGSVSHVMSISGQSGWAPGVGTNVLGLIVINGDSVSHGVYASQFDLS